METIFQATRRAISDFQEGQSFSRKLPISSSLMQAFAEASGDVHPLHVDEGFANERGFRGRVAYGNLLSLMISSLIGMDLKCPDVMLISQRINYRNPFFLGDEITLNALLETVSEAVGVLEFKLDFTNQKGEQIATGKCQAKVLEPST